MTRQPWEREPGESAKAFAAFECYRRLPPGERSLQRAWEDHSHRPGQMCERRGKEAGKPPGHWTGWMSRWHWTARALAWDEQLAGLARDQELDRELQRKAREHEEEIRQRQLWKQEARAARTLARRLLLRALQGIDSGEIENMKVREILPHTHRISTLLEVGQRLERMALGEATDRTESIATPDPALADLAQRIAELLEGGTAEGLALADLARIADGGGGEGAE